MPLPHSLISMDGHKLMNIPQSTKFICLATTLTSDLENFSRNSHSHEEYLWQVSLKYRH